MSMRYEDLPVDFQEKIASNAGIMLRDFNPATGEFSTADIVCATSGGLAIRIDLRTLTTAFLIPKRESRSMTLR